MEKAPSKRSRKLGRTQRTPAENAPVTDVLEVPYALVEIKMLSGEIGKGLDVFENLPGLDAELSNRLDAELKKLRQTSAHLARLSHSVVNVLIEAGAEELTNFGLNDRERFIFATGLQMYIGRYSEELSRAEMERIEYLGLALSGDTGAENISHEGGTSDEQQESNASGNV